VCGSDGECHADLDYTKQTDVCDSDGKGVCTLTECAKPRIATVMCLDIQHDEVVVGVAGQPATWNANITLMPGDTPCNEADVGVRVSFADNTTGPFVAVGPVNVFSGGVVRVQNTFTINGTYSALVDVIPINPDKCVVPSVHVPCVCVFVLYSWLFILCTVLLVICSCAFPNTACRHDISVVVSFGTGQSNEPPPVDDDSGVC